MSNLSQYRPKNVEAWYFSGHMEELPYWVKDFLTVQKALDLRPGDYIVRYNNGRVEAVSGNKFDEKWERIDND